MYGGAKAALLRGEPFRGFAFMHGETICGGSGAGATWNGVSAVYAVSQKKKSFLSPFCIALCFPLNKYCIA
jgi:N-methylhydantoinase B/oxoprolinase/acetone carboxylase alpha subunit